MRNLRQRSISVGVLSTKNEDVRSLRELVTYGLKGMAAYAEHASNLGFEDKSIDKFIQEALVATTDDTSQLLISLLPLYWRQGNTV